MRRELIQSIQKCTEVLFFNAGVMLQTCNLEYVLCDMPLWKHVYHALHSCDQWYINPRHYTEPDFNEPNLNSLDVASAKTLSRDALSQYLADIRAKILAYLESLKDDLLYEVPPDCKENRLTMILSQFRHFYAHLGNINAITIIETNRWPRVVGTSGKRGAFSERLYE